VPCGGGLAGKPTSRQNAVFRRGLSATFISLIALRLGIKNLLALTPEATNHCQLSLAPRRQLFFADHNLSGHGAACAEDGSQRDCPKGLVRSGPRVTRGGRRKVNSLSHALPDAI